MTYPDTPGFQAHSDTSREAAARLQSAESMEKDIFAVLDAYDSGWTGDELAEYLDTRGHAGVQTGTIAARLRGLELKGMAVKTKETRPTRSNRQAHVWLSKRLATRNGSELAPTANGPTVQELQRRVTTLELENENLKRAPRPGQAFFYTNSNALGLVHYVGINPESGAIVVTNSAAPDKHLRQIAGWQHLRRAPEHDLTPPPFTDYLLKGI